MGLPLVASCWSSSILGFTVCLKKHRNWHCFVLLPPGCSKERHWSAHHLHPSVHQTGNSHHHRFPSAWFRVRSWHSRTHHLRLWRSGNDGNGSFYFLLPLVSSDKITYVRVSGDLDYFGITIVDQGILYLRFTFLFDLVFVQIFIIAIMMFKFCFV